MAQPPTLAELVQQLHQAQQQIQQLTLHAQSQQAALQAVPQAAAASSFLRIRTPTPFKGEMGPALDNWEREILQQFEFYQTRFPTESSKILFAGAYLTEVALQFFQSESERLRAAGTPLASFAELMILLRGRFSPVQAASLARRALKTLVQGGRQSVNSYTNRFHTVIQPIKNMDVADRVAAYVDGLLPVIAGKVFEKNPATLEEAINHAVLVEQMILYGHGSRAAGGPGGFRGGSSSGSSAPMDLSQLEDGEEQTEKAPADRGASEVLAAIQALEAQFDAKLNALSSRFPSSSSSKKPFSKSSGSRNHVSGLSRDELSRRLTEDSCLVCGKQGHWKNECPEWKRNSKFGQGKQ